MNIRHVDKKVLVIKTSLMVVILYIHVYIYETQACVGMVVIVVNC